MRKEKKEWKNHKKRSSYKVFFLLFDISLVYFCIYLKKKFKSCLKEKFSEKFQIICVKNKKRKELDPICYQKKLITSETDCWMRNKSFFKRFSYQIRTLRNIMTLKLNHLQGKLKIHLPNNNNKQKRANKREQAWHTALCDHIYLLTYE